MKHDIVNTHTTAFLPSPLWLSTAWLKLDGHGPGLLFSIFPKHHKGYPQCCLPSPFPSMSRKK